MYLLLVAAVFLGALIVCLLCSFDLFWALALTFAALFLCARRRGHPVKELRNLIRRELLEKTYLDAGATREELALDISCSVVTIAGLIPWCIACSVPLTMLGAGFSAIPYACYLYLIPLCYLFTKRFFFPAKTKVNEVTKP